MTDLTVQLEYFLEMGRNQARGVWANFEAATQSEAERFASALQAYAPHAETPSSVAIQFETDDERGVVHVFYRTGAKRGPKLERKS